MEIGKKYSLLLNPPISLHILHAPILYTFPLAMMRRACLASILCDHFFFTGLLFSQLFVRFSSDVLRGNKSDGDARRKLKGRPMWVPLKL